MIIELAIAFIFCIAFIFLITYILAKPRKKKRNSDDTVRTIRLHPSTNTSGSFPTSQASATSSARRDTPIVEGATVTAEDIRNAPQGRYSWDETGAVFEVNDDGSVSSIGQYDIAELEISPKQKLFQQMKEDGLLEMLPRIWSFSTLSENTKGKWNFGISYLGRDESVECITDGANIIECVREGILAPQSADGEIPGLLNMLMSADEGTVVLMPFFNEQEYILSLGAQAYLNRMFDGKYKVLIVHPVEMSALWTAMKQGLDTNVKVTFASEIEGVYSCCSLTAANGEFTVKSISSSSIILPSSAHETYYGIASGAMVYSYLRQAEVKGVNVTLLYTYPLSLVVKDGASSHTYPFASQSKPLPYTDTLKSIPVSPNAEVSFAIGDCVVMDNVLEGLPVVDSIDVCVRFGPATGVRLEVQGGDKVIISEIGALIG